MRVVLIALLLAGCGPSTGVAVPAPGSPTPSVSRVPAPAEGRAVDTPPTVVVRDCTSAGVAAAVAGGGVIAFDCGASPVTIRMGRTVRVRADTVLDGGGRVTLSGGGERRLFVVDGVALTIQNLTLVEGNGRGTGGGAVLALGGRLKVVDSRFARNRCGTGSGGALRVVGQRAAVYVVGSTFEDGRCRHGGALSGDVSWEIIDSVLRRNTATGNGGAVHADGDHFTVRLAGTLLEHNRAAEGGGAVYFLSGERTGTMTIEGGSVLRDNVSTGFETDGFPGVFFLGSGVPRIHDSTVER